MEIIDIDIKENLNNGGVARINIPEISGKKRINQFYKRLSESFLYACGKNGGKIFGRMECRAREYENLLSVSVSCRIFANGESISAKYFSNVWDADAQTLKYIRRGLKRKTNLTLSGEKITENKVRIH